MASSGWGTVTEVEARRMGRKGSGTLLGGGSSHLKSADRGKGTPEASTPQNGSKSKYRAIPCIVTEDLTLFTKEDIEALEEADRAPNEPLTDWSRWPLKARADRVTVRGIWFGSLKEGKRYIYLAGLQKAGGISGLLLQPIYRIMVKPMIGEGDYEEVAKYVGDFQYETSHGAKVVEDTKGNRLPLYKLKKKIVERLYGIKILET